MRLVEFLEWWKPGGPWTLCAFSLDRRSNSAGTFRTKDVDRLVEWLTGQTELQRNIYFHVNSLIADIAKKAEREDVLSVDFLHVDLDPRAGENIDEERVRILKTLSSPTNGIPKPTAIVFSGGGYQGFWRLKQSIVIDGNLSKAEEAKCFNMQLEILFGGDHCHNIDRIMRCPYTLNFPNERKQKKGQKIVLAEVVELNEDRVYPIEDFTPAQLVKSDRGASVKQRVEISGNVARIADLDDLDKLVTGDPLPDWTKMVIVNGFDPDDPQKHESRSEWQHAVSCQLVRSGIPDDVHFSILTDPDFKISTSILDKGSRVEDYAIRQIVRAHEVTVAPELAEMNVKHAVIGNWGGKCRVMQEVWDPSMGRNRLTRQSFEDVRNRYCNVNVQIGTDKDGNPIFKKMGDWWLKHPMRRTFESIVFVPNGDGGPDNYNLWSGFQCEAIPGEWDLFHAHMMENMCGGNEGYYNYLIGWMAHAVQRPDLPGYAGVVLRGAQGTGKSFWALEFGNLWGKHFLHVSSPSHVVGNFNSHLRDCCVLFADEAFYAGDKKHRSTLKALITEDTLVIEGKGVDAEIARNHVHLIMASNDDWVVGAEKGDRRFFVLDVIDKHKDDGVYFGAIRKQMDSGGREGLLHFLLNYDLSSFDVRSIPKTEALRDQQKRSLEPEMAWWYDKLLTGRILEHHGEWDQQVWRHELVHDFAQALRLQRWSNQQAAGGALGAFLKKVCPAGWPRARQKRGVTVESQDIYGNLKKFEGPRTWIFQELGDMREYWETMYGKQEWPEADEIVESDSENDDGVF